MDIISTQKQISSKLKIHLERLGFETEEYSPHFHTVQFFQTRNKITKYISLQFYNDSNGILQLRGFISSDEVNHILGKFIDLKVNKEYCTIKDFGQKQTISDGIENLNRIGKEKDLDQYVLAILGHIKSIILPFFDMFPDFGALNDFINKLNTHNEEVNKKIESIRTTYNVSKNS